MPRPSPSSVRIVEFLEFLADRPDESFRLSEIARSVGFNKATAHGMLAVLAEAEYLGYDEPSKTFSLGPTVVKLGQAAVADDSKLAVIARPEMDALSKALGAQCVVNTAVGDELVVTASTGKPAGGRGAYVGYRSRMVPPLGMVFYAWASEARVDVWLDRISTDAQERARYRMLRAVVRERGYSVSAEQETRERLDVALQQLCNGSDREEIITETLTQLIADMARDDHELIDIVADCGYRTRQLSAPIFDAQGVVRLGLLVIGLPESTGSKLVEYADLTVEAARRITRLVAGSDAAPNLR